MALLECPRPASRGEVLASRTPHGVARAAAAAFHRLLTPSLSDCLLGSLLVWLFASGHGWQGLLADGDTGWHIRTGEVILATGRIPTRDLFSFSRPGEPWYAWEWLADVVYALVHRSWGLPGVVLLGGVVIVAATMVLFRHMLWKGANAFAALAVTLLATGASSIHYLARPHVYSFLLLAVSLWILDRDRRSASKSVWILVPLTALWVNLHGGFVALLASIGLVAGGCAIEALVGRDRSKWRLCSRYGALWIACAAASLANPYGFRLHLHIAAYLRSGWIREAVEEFQAPRFRSESLLHYEILLLAAVLIAGRLLAERRVTEVLPILFWAHLSLGSVRHVPVFAIMCGPLVASELSRFWESWTVAAQSRSVPCILHAVARDMSGGFRRTSVWSAVAALAVVLLCASSKWPRDFPEAKFPVAMVQKHGSRLAAARVFTSDQWGDYLIYRNWPRQRVFIDGRSDFYGPGIGKLYLQLAHAHSNWEQILDRYAFGMVLSPPEWPLAALLRRDPGWRLVEEGSGAALFERIDSFPHPASKVAALHVR